MFAPLTILLLKFVIIIFYLFISFRSDDRTFSFARCPVCVCWLCLCARVCVGDMHPYIIFILFGSRQDVISFVCRLFTLDFHHSALCTHVSANLWCHRFVKMLTDLFNVQPVFFSSQKYYFTCLLVYIANRDDFNHCF